MNDQSPSSLDVATDNRLRKLRRRISAQGVATLPRWASEWVYWNGGLHHVAKKMGRPPRKFGVRDPIIVYQMGKVGSSTLFHSLVQLQLDVPVYQIHYLNHMDEHEKMLRHMAPHDNATPHMFEVGRAIRAEMARKPNKKWNLISLVRTPAPRSVSAYFEGLEMFLRQMGHSRVEDVTPTEAVSYYLSRFRDDTPLVWFDEQIKELFGLDVFAVPFDKARGYQIYKHRNVRLIVIRLEDLNRVVSTAMREFLGLEAFALSNKNVGETKHYSALYQEFLKQLRLPPAMVERFHSTQLARHFYTPDELAASVAHWVETPTETAV